MAREEVSRGDVASGTALDGIELPASARLLGWELLEASPDEGRVRVRFEARPEFANPAGFVQGGFLAAMLDDVMGPAMFVRSAGTIYAVTLDLHVSYLAPARPGALFAEGRVVSAGQTIGHLEASLTDADGALIARAAATVRLVPSDRLPDKGA
jgi:uncharacterized protein (TIGR00369 family)